MSHPTLFGLAVLLIAAPSFAQTNTAKRKTPPSDVLVVGKWTCVPGDPNAKIINYDFRSDGTVSIQVLGGSNVASRYTANGNILAGEQFTNNAFRFAGTDTMLVTVPILGNQTCKRIVPMPVQGPAEPDESYAWQLVMHEINSMWDGAFSGMNGKPCIGALIATMPNVNWEQIQGFRPNVRTELLPLTQADRLNGDQFRARFYFSVQAARYYNPQVGWGRWDTSIGDAVVPGQQNFGVFVEKHSGAWTANMFGINFFYKRYAFACEAMPK